MPDLPAPVRMASLTSKLICRTVEVAYCTSMWIASQELGMLLRTLCQGSIKAVEIVKIPPKHFRVGWTLYDVLLV